MRTRTGPVLEGALGEGRRMDDGKGRRPPGEMFELPLPPAPPLPSLRGDGVRIAVVDSGVHAAHPHIGGVAGGVGIGSDGARTADFSDRLGHGTAVSAVIREKAPGVELFAVRVFHDCLRAGCDALVHAVGWAAEQGVRIVNLSLGTTNPAHRNRLADALGAASARDVVVVSARDNGDVGWLPGSLPEAVGVRLDWSCPRHSVRIAADSGKNPVFLASGFPRPIPGVSPARNLAGISFAVANVTGVLAGLMEKEPGVQSPEGVFDLVRAHPALRPVTR